MKEHSISCYRLLVIGGLLGAVGSHFIGFPFSIILNSFVGFSMGCIPASLWLIALTLPQFQFTEESIQLQPTDPISSKQTQLFEQLELGNSTSTPHSTKRQTESIDVDDFLK